MTTWEIAALILGGVATIPTVILFTVYRKKRNRR